MHGDSVVCELTGKLYSSPLPFPFPLSLSFPVRWKSLNRIIGEKLTRIFIAVQQQSNRMGNSPKCSIRQQQRQSHRHTRAARKSHPHDLDTMWCEFGNLLFRFIGGIFVHLTMALALESFYDVDDVCHQVRTMLTRPDTHGVARASLTTIQSRRRI